MTLTFHAWQILPLVLAIFGILLLVSGFRSRPSSMLDFSGHYVALLGFLFMLAAGLWCLAYWLGGRSR